MAEVFRATARVLLVDERDRLFLLLTKWPAAVDRPARWITPGGGIDPGESVTAAAIRELREETGLEIDDPGPVVHEERFRMERTDGHVDVGHATYFLHRTTAFEPSRDGWTPEELVDVLDARWWTLDELDATDEPMQPADLVSIARNVLQR
ncbi:ADP-ribose pyrophosphatase YjhB (NUDIX family) [Diaminobutyricimonas aerilata]|uniref:ADP-ribose pyrophosphatase YjhB (NUDIX family) n=1 Tax=Diaminobutyricimonas aerilata TaxID=1162967 RepID=A0A2M9CJS8_9MICO|nr:NUDIX domain-containing protein [Diaminobutyricimonas aerilata]PJJ72149.1 ADP-ribose pyrophosphatase YjhB (NUDIX family) [Diaminobutyricimonas aerilata]